MDALRLATGEARTYLNAELLEPHVFELAGGSAAVISMRRPEKTTANEDAAAIVSAGPRGAVLIVADGCGGMASGEQAARIAVECLASHVSAAVMAEGASLRGAILDGVDAANRQILDMKNGAGATLAVVQLEAGQARPYHVGDAQILLVGGRGKVKLLTTAHSPVGYAVEAGLLELHEAMDHDERHLVSNYLGSDAMHVDVGSGRKVASRDGLLLASDGVLDNLTIDELIVLLKSGGAPQVAAQIAAIALQRMEVAQDGLPHKPDDLTLIVYTQRGVRAAAPPRETQLVLIDELEPRQAGETA
ncbi:MAG: protein phosphatase 2C domain-containing protein [Pirellulales bacterium]|nr:protein phosphatase 2C domain-containing protein [Pirellulales bacterium]